METKSPNQNPRAIQDRHGSFPVERAPNGSRDPLTLDVNWDWRNPFNVLPLGALILAIGGVVLFLLK